MHVQHDQDALQLSRGVYIVEGPNWPVISWCLVGILLVSFVVSFSYALIMKTQESGFGVGQWMVAVLTAVMTAVVVQLREALTVCEQTKYNAAALPYLKGELWRLFFSWR